ncbi:MAG: nitrilase [Clostridiales bacterium]|nr:nitrilase [Clostridiales bacterium]MCF8022867.1 nitrilase [Clostridiales bacterium]
MNDVTIALAQVEARFGQVEQNLAKIRDFTREAASKGTNIICFPELCVHGYQRENVHRIAEPVPGSSSDFIISTAKETGVVVLAGMAEDSGEDKPFNTHVIAYPDGMLQKYRKTHLGKSEEAYFSPASVLPVYSGPGASFGIEICWEMHFPEISTILSIKGAEIIFAPHASPIMVGDRKEIWLKYLSARAYDNSAFVAACNLTGKGDEKQNFCGGALVIDPKGNVVSEAFNEREELLVTRLDSGLLNKIRCQESRSMRHSFFLNARRPELYGELL